MSRAEELIETFDSVIDFDEEKWSGSVKTKWSPPEGLFSSGSSSEIASKAISGHGGDLGKAVQSISFYLNRAGKNLPTEQKDRVEKAKEIVQKQIEQEAS